MPQQRCVFGLLQREEMPLTSSRCYLSAPAELAPRVRFWLSNLPKHLSTRLPSLPYSCRCAGTGHRLRARLRRG